MQHTLLSLAIALTIASPSYSQDSSSCELTATGLYGGTTLSIRLQSTEALRPATVLFGQPTILSLPSPNPIVGIDPSSAYRFDGTTGPDGEFRIDYALPNQPIFPGRTLFGQGFVMHRQGLYLASERIALKGQASQSALWQEVNAAMPSSAADFLGTDVQAVDYDRDGDLDLLIASEFEVFCYTNDGTGRFTDETQARIPLDNLGCFLLAKLDFDLDGDQDFVSFGRVDNAGSSAGSAIFENDGAGNFTKYMDLPTSLADADAGCVGDFTGNGFPDIILGEGVSYTSGIPVPHQIVSIFHNDAGVFTLDAASETAAWNFTEDEFIASCTGDVDKDGDLDLYFAMTGVGGARNILLFNDGTGTFVDMTLSHTPDINYGDGDKSSAAVFADVNNDGYLDIMVANSWLTQASDMTGDLLMNEGEVNPGSFVDAPTAWVEYGDPECVVNIGLSVGDVDLDGDVDIMLNPSEWINPAGFPPFVGHPMLFLNQGGAQGGTLGVFEKDLAFWTPGPMTTFFTYFGELFDADSDGDLDYFVPSMGGFVDPTKTQGYYMSNRLQ